MDARRAPQRIVNAHPLDQRAQFRIDLRPTSKGPGLLPPVPTETGPMPTHQGLGPDDVMAFRTDEDHRYSMTKNKRSPFVSWTRPRTLRRSTIS
jgi:hypothetical protein